jgi:deoxyribonuclease-2
MQCLDDGGQPVDWWMMMKLPLNVGPVSGYSYLYWDTNAPSTAKQGDFHYHDQAVGYTVMQLGLYGATVPRLKDDYAWVLWNDESYGSWEDKDPIWHQNDTSGVNYGHTKGVLAVQLSSKTGFYLQHSAPAFPYNHTASPSYWHFPWSQSVFAQHFFCISLSLTQVESVAKLARYYYAYVYEAQIPSAGKSALPQLTALAGMQYVNGSGTVGLQTLGGVSLTLIGKSASVDGDLYEDYVARQLNSGVQVQSWCCGSDGDCCQPAYCKGSPIVNASGPQRARGEKAYPFDSVDVLSVSWGNDLHYLLSGNHAKWLVAEDSTTRAICFGDINRMISQRARGGGALCLSNENLYTTLHSAVVKVDPTC